MHRFILAAIGALVALPVSSFAAVIYSQTPSSSTGTAYASDVDYPHQTADDFTLGSAATVRSVTWRGVYDGNTPLYPLSFQLTLYGDASNLPNTSAVQSTTPVQFTSPVQVTNTGIVLLGGYTVYEFSANITPTALAGSTKYWFSALADTTNDIDNWYWSTGDTSASTAFRSSFSGPFNGSNVGPLYFILNDTFVPEPAGLVLLGVGALALLRRRIP